MLLNLKSISKSLAFLWALHFLQIAHGQDLLALRHFNTEDFKMDFYIDIENKSIKYDDSLFYYWFKAQKIHVSQGHSSGDVLHGKFVKYYVNGQLAEAGVFQFGLKTGVWTSWHENGQISERYEYKKGLKSGNFILYNEEGHLIEKGKYKKNKKKERRVKKQKIKKSRNKETPEESDLEPAENSLKAKTKDFFAKFDLKDDSLTSNSTETDSLKREENRKNRRLRKENRTPKLKFKKQDD